MYIGWIGCGKMGTGMISRLITSGHSVTIYNRTQEKTDSLVAKGAIQAHSPREAVIKADIIFSTVTDDEASCAVWEGKDGIAFGLQDHAIAIDCSTLSLTRCVTLCNYITNNSGAYFLTAPLIGSSQDAAEGSLIFLLGGNPDILPKINDILILMSKNVTYVGSNVQAMALKLALTASTSIQIMLQIELLNFLKTNELNTSMITLFNNLPFTKGTMDMIDTLTATDQFSQLFPLDLIHKDLSNLILSQHFMHLTPALTTAARDIYARATIEEKCLKF